MRKGALTLSVSASAIVAILAAEGFRGDAYIPVKGDVPTIGYGTTTRPDGSPVQMGDRITEPEARARAVTDINNVYAAGVQKCLGDTLVYQHEFDALVDIAYNVGVMKVCNSGMVRNFKAGNYEAGCAVILQYKYFTEKDKETGRIVFRDCFAPENVRRCGGIKKRREYEYRLCMGLL